MEHKCALTWTSIVVLDRGFVYVGKVIGDGSGYGYGDGFQTAAVRFF